MTPSPLKHFNFCCSWLLWPDLWRNKNVLAYNAAFYGSPFLDHRIIMFLKIIVFFVCFFLSQLWVYIHNSVWYELISELSVTMSELHDKSSQFRVIKSDLHGIILLLRVIKSELHDINLQLRVKVRIVLYKLTIMSYKVRIVWYKLTIASYTIRLVRFFFFLHAIVFKSCNCECLFLFFLLYHIKSQLWEITLGLQDTGIVTFLTILKFISKFWLNFSKLWDVNKKL